MCRTRLASESVSIASETHDAVVSMRARSYRRLPAVGSEIRMEQLPSRSRPSSYPVPRLTPAGKSIGLEARCNHSRPDSSPSTR
jgi:hypothetical protein